MCAVPARGISLFPPMLGMASSLRSRHWSSLTLEAVQHLMVRINSRGNKKNCFPIIMNALTPLPLSATSSLRGRLLPSHYFPSDIGRLSSVSGWHLTEDIIRLTRPHPELLVKLGTPFPGAFGVVRFAGWTAGFEEGEAYGYM